MGPLIFISAFPGSRTAWLAVAIALAGVSCGHESANAAPTLLRLMRAGARWVEVNALLPLFWEELHALTAGAYQRIHITRARADAQSSVARRYPDAGELPELFDRIEAGLTAWNTLVPPLVVPFDGLSAPAWQGALCAALHVPFDPDQWAHLSQYQIVRRT